MDKARFLIETQLRTGRPLAELAAAHGMHRSWLYKLLARYRVEGEAGLEPRSRRPNHSPTRIADRHEEAIITLRKELTDLGVDAGAVTIHYHLSKAGGEVPSVPTIWRVLKARGFVTPSRRSVRRAPTTISLPTSRTVLAGRRDPRRSHPQTCGKVERFHQTLKRYFAKQEPATTKKQLQTQLDHFVAYYNEVRPHRGLQRRTPGEFYAAREKSFPCGPCIDSAGYRVRHDKVDKKGTVTLRHKGRLHHIGLGRA